ncbi:PEGA domain-containing protein [Aquimarina algicola]|uniref:PEGA domain-containing protein n=1 Tax=Aquimarina algicola TaxID=2589995 RepID=A0A504IZS1_9FLAO|nr:PEGA domain-containing protein [Aquimarina algicola]TPN84036.1 PEGA domain-containing protein [Aquimarina algicola]
MEIITKALLFSSIILLSNCATIISGSRQIVEISSEPNSAKVYINEIEVGETPVQKRLKRNQTYQLTLKLDGYKTYDTKLEKKFNAWYVGNVVFGGLIGLIVDPATGAMFKLKPEEIDKQIKNGTTYKTKHGNIYLNVSMEIDPNWQKIGQLEKLDSY